MTLKFRLKRKKPAKVIRKEKRKIAFGKHYTDWSYRKNKPGGKVYPKTIYQLEDQFNNQTDWHRSYRTNIVNYGEWFAFDILKRAKNESQKKRIYKMYPKHSPKHKRQLEHQKKIEKWQAKLKANELIQNQNHTN